MFPISDTKSSGGFPFVNILLILANIWVFFLELSAPDTTSFIQHYALIPATVSLAQPNSLWQFITAMFLHSGLLHIVSNMWFLWVFGDNVEGALGHVRYLVLYFVAGIIGNLTQYLLMPISQIPLLGASGAIAGVLGAYLILFPNHKIKTFVPIFFFFTIIDVSALLMLGYWFILQLFSVLMTNPNSMDGGIAFWAHIGGFVMGMILARFLVKSHNNDILEGEIIS